MARSPFGNATLTKATIDLSQPRNVTDITKLTLLMWGNEVIGIELKFCSVQELSARWIPGLRGMVIKLKKLHSSEHVTRSLLQCMSPLLAQSGHHDRAKPCPLSGVKRTSA